MRKQSVALHLGEKKGLVTDMSDDFVKSQMKYYHKLYTCYKWKYKRAKRLALALGITSVSLIAVGDVIGVVTANPIPLAIISGSGLVLLGYINRSGINKKKEMCRFAYTSYRKILLTLRSFQQGCPYDREEFLAENRVLNEIVTDLCPTINGMEKKYDRLFTKNGGVMEVIH